MEGDGEALRLRHDGFTPARQKKFLKALAKTGCVKDACRRAGISDTTAYRARARLPGLAKKWDTALEMTSTELEAIAFARAVEGAEEQVIRDGKVVSIKKKPSDAMLRMIMQASNPKKYGRIGHGGMTVAQREKLEREIEKRVRKQIDEEQDDPAHLKMVRERIGRKLANLRQDMIKEGAFIEATGDSTAPVGWGPITEEAKQAFTDWKAAQAAKESDIYTKIRLQREEADRRREEGEEED